MAPSIRSVDPVAVRVTDKTTWVFVRLVTDDGVTGLGESTRFGLEDDLCRGIEAISTDLAGQSLEAIDRLATETAPPNSDPVLRSVVSALEQAAWDVRAQLQNKPVHELLGTTENKTMEIYANINRRTEDRSTKGFADSARDALAAGYRKIKIAPFDGLSPAVEDYSDAQYRSGLDRIDAVCDAVSQTDTVMVDCHWRLSMTVARHFIEAAAERGLYWVECPIPEDADRMVDLRALKQQAETQGVRLAGAERGMGLSDFAPYLDSAVYDVIMPDIKHVGGFAEFQRIAVAANQAGIAVSPHNPSGPVCHVASLHVAAILPNLLNIEHQFDESPLFFKICAEPLPAVTNGTVAAPDGAGLGITLSL